MNTTTAAPPADRDTSKLKWYVVHTYSGFENRAKKSLEEQIKQKGLEANFGEILIPMETVEEQKNGQKRTQKRKFAPGYIFVQMEMNDVTWHLVKNTPKVTGFIGADKNERDKLKVPSVPEKQVLAMTQQLKETAAKPTPKIDFEPGDNVLAEVRLRLIVERYLDPGADGVYGNSTVPGPDGVAGTYDDPADANPPFQPGYKYRVIASEEIR